MARHDAFLSLCVLEQEISRVCCVLLLNRLLLEQRGCLARSWQGEAFESRAVLVHHFKRLVGRLPICIQAASELKRTVEVKSSRNLDLVQVLDVLS